MECVEMDMLLGRRSVMEVMDVGWRTVDVGVDGILMNQ
jgi:hypothetical protein